MSRAKEGECWCFIVEQFHVTYKDRVYFSLYCLTYLKVHEGAMFYYRSASGADEIGVSAWSMRRVDVWQEALPLPHPNLWHVKTFTFFSGWVAVANLDRNYLATISVGKKCRILGNVCKMWIVQPWVLSGQFPRQCRNGSIMLLHFEFEIQWPF